MRLVCLRVDVDIKAYPSATLRIIITLMCVCPCMGCTYVCRYTCAHVCIWMKKWEDRGPCSFFGLRFGLSLAFNVTGSSRLAQPLNSRGPPSSASHLTNTGVTSVQSWVHVFLQGLSMQTQVLTLTSQEFYWLSYSSCPQITFQLGKAKQNKQKHLWAKCGECLEDNQTNQLGNSETAV